jgi:hypothetical protein
MCAGVKAVGEPTWSHHGAFQGCWQQHTEPDDKDSVSDKLAVKRGDRCAVMLRTVN